jgi:hypothetical protein
MNTNENSYVTNLSTETLDKIIETTDKHEESLKKTSEIIVAVNDIVFKQKKEIDDLTKALEKVIGLLDKDQQFISFLLKKYNNIVLNLQIGFFVTTAFFILIFAILYFNK